MQKRWFKDDVMIHEDLTSFKYCSFYESYDSVTTKKIINLLNAINVILPLFQSIKVQNININYEKRNKKSFQVANNRLKTIKYVHKLLNYWFQGNAGLSPKFALKQQRVIFKKSITLKIRDGTFFIIIQFYVKVLNNHEEY